MSSERRKHPRLSCTLRCELEVRGKPCPGTLRNVSEGGLSVRALLIESPREGEPVGVTLHPPSKPPIAVEALVWHQRAPKQGVKDRASVLGLVLSNGGDDFFAFVQELRRRRTPPTSGGQPVRLPVADAGPAAEAEALPPPDGCAPPPPGDAAQLAGELPAPEEPPALRRFAVRVKQDTGPRSRRVMIAGSGAEDARARALEEVGAGWSVLEVEPVGG